MSTQKDASGLTKQERHDIVINYLKEINKPTKVFHLRWRPGDLLNGKILRSTPMFWYMKYQWGRAQIEEMFFRARIEIDDAFDRSLQQVFGGEAGPRWRGGVIIPKQKKWKMQAEENARKWQGQQAEHVVTRDNVNQKVTDYNKTSDDNNRMRNKMAQNIGTKNKEIWNAVSDFGADKSIDYKTFSDNLKDRGINVSPMLAKQLFDQLAGKKGKINQQEMDAIVRQLDKVTLPTDFAQISWNDMSGKLGAQLVMKRVLLAASAGEPFNVDDFVFASKFGVNISPVQFMGKLTDRDVEWDDRVRSMEAVSANIGSNPLFNDLLADANIPDLLCGWCSQMLDNKPEVQKTAIELMPNVFHESVEKGNPQIAIGHLEEILDNLFKVLDDPKCSRNHPAAKAAVNKIVDDVIALNDPDHILYLAGLLSEKCDLENVTSAPARAFALEQIQKIMFDTEPSKTSATEWANIAVNKQTAPSKAMYTEYKPADEYWGDESGAIAGKSYRPQQRRVEEKEYPQAGVGPDETMTGFPLDPAAPYAHIASFPTNAMVLQPVKFDASKSHDCDHQPVKNYVWNFGDGSPEVTTTKPYVDHPYKKAQVYPVTVTVTDKYGKKARAGLNQRVNDPKNPLPPYAAISSTPPTQNIKKMVTFDASKSHDGDKQPCVNYTFDFGDGTDPVSTPKPVVNHAYDKKGSYPVHVTVTDKDGQTAKAFLTQRIVDPQQQDPTLPYAAVESTPKDPKPHDPVTFDASKSVDCDGDPCKNYVWDFGDFSPKVTTTKPVVNHAYNKPGTYPVKVTVTDKYNKSVPATCKTMVIPSVPVQNTAKSIAPRLPPTVILKSNPKETVPMQPVYFDASDSHDYKNEPCVSFLWDFGDNSPKVTTTEPYTNHPYKESGTYPVSVIATDKYRQTGEASVNQRVREPGPMDPYAAVSSTPNDPLPSKPVRLDATESVDHKGNPCKNFIWDFGDHSPPQTTTKPVVNHVYNEPGSYPVNVTVVDRYGKKANASLTQRVKDPKPVKSTIGPPHAHLASAPKVTKPYEVVDFDASKSHDFEKMPCKSFVWDFGDGSPQETTNGPYTAHKYANPGTYPVVVEVEDKHGQKASASVNQRVVPDPPFDGARKIPKVPPTKKARTGLTEHHLPPYAGVRSNPTNANPQEQVLFDASESQDYTGDPPVEYQWNFGDGTPVIKTNKPKVNHAYNKPGSYPVNCTVVDKFHQKGNASLTQRVKAPKDIGPPYAALESTPKLTKPDELVHFDASKSHDAQNKPCVKYVWDFGDSTTKTTDVPRVDHPYKKTGTYPVTVEVFDKRGKSAKASVSHPVHDEDEEISPIKGKIYRSQQHADNPKTQHYGDIGPEEKMESDPTKAAKTGLIVPKGAKTGLIVPKGAKTGLIQPNAAQTGLIVPYKPMDPYAAVRSTPTAAKPQEKVQFDASESQDADGDPPLEYNWSFGDNSPQVKTNKPFIDHAYDKPGTYPVKCTVTDKWGNPAHATCTQRVINPQNPQIGKPYAALASAPKETLPFEPVDFDASSSHAADGSPLVEYDWDFGDGTPIIKTKKPVTDHAYDKPGTYPVTVSVVDKYGQKANASVAQRVSVEDPFSRNDNDPLAPPVAHLEGRPKTAYPQQQVTFDASLSHDMDNAPCVSFEWDFGDGSPSKTTKEPITQHPYKKIGHYPTTVTVTDKHGQKDKAHTNTQVTDTDPAKTSRIDVIRPPVAVLESQPKETLPKEIHNFDASKSKDMYGKPCIEFKWDFGDNSAPKTTKGPYTTHAYQKIGYYPVTVEVKDRNGLKDKATVQQKVSQTIPARASTEWDPIESYSSIAPVEKTHPAYASFVDTVGPPTAALEGRPKVTAPNELVDFDASRSHDWEGKPCVEFTFDFGDNSPNVTQKSPFVKHAYKKVDHYPVSCVVKDKNGLTAIAHCNQKVIDSDPSHNSRVDEIYPPYAHLVGIPPETRPNVLVDFDASKSKDMYDKPCVEFKWDFGDGSPQETTSGPYTKHAYKEIGHYPVTVTVKDVNGLTAAASCNEKVSETIPPYSGATDVPNPLEDFNRNDPDEFKDEPTFSRMDPEELGDEFRAITSDAVSKALMDPSRLNSKKGKQLTDIMKQLNPQWPNELDPEAKRRYNKYNFPIRPYQPKLPPNPKIGIKAGDKDVNIVDLGMTVDFGSFEPPDI